MRNVIASLIIMIMGAGCTAGNSKICINEPKGTIGKMGKMPIPNDKSTDCIEQPKSTMPNPNDKPTQSQRMAIMSGEQPDWDNKDGSSIRYSVTW